MPEGRTSISRIIVTRSAQLPLFLEALWMLLKWDVLAKLGYATLCREMNLGISSKADLNPEDWITEVVAAVNRARRYYPKSVACLQRSVALASMLRKRGIAADLKIGIRQGPFTSHAWVEVGDRVLNDDVQQVRELYITLYEFKAMPSKPFDR
jgi:Transglutaminase-like superfamily